MDDKNDTAYNDGFEAGVVGSGSFNDNPYDAGATSIEERELYDAYEQGFADGEKTASQ